MGRLSNLTENAKPFTRVKRFGRGGSDSVGLTDPFDGQKNVTDNAILYLIFIILLQSLKERHSLLLSHAPLTSDRTDRGLSVRRHPVASTRVRSPALTPCSFWVPPTNTRRVVFVGRYDLSENKR